MPASICEFYFVGSAKLEGPKLLRSGGIMVAKLKLKGIVRKLQLTWDKWTNGWYGRPKASHIIHLKSDKFLWILATWIFDDDDCACSSSHSIICSPFWMCCHTLRISSMNKCSSSSPSSSPSLPPAANWPLTPAQ